MNFNKLILVVFFLAKLADSKLNYSISESYFLIKEKTLQSETDLKKLQKSIILQRNHKCINREYFDLINLKEHEKNTNQITNESIEYNLEKTVVLDNNKIIFLFYSSFLVF